MNARRVLWWGFAAVVIFFVIAQPDAAADIVHRIIDMLKEGASQLIAFLQGVFRW